MSTEMTDANQQIVEHIFERTVSNFYDAMEDASTDAARPPVARERLEDMKDELDNLVLEFAEYQRPG